MADPIDYTRTRVLASGQEKREEDQIAELQAAIERVRTLYYLFFLGTNAKPPYKERNDLDNHARRVRNNLPKRTAQRFKMQQVLTRYQNLAEHWDKSLRGLEEGTRMPWVPISQRMHVEAPPEPAASAASAAPPAASNGAEASGYLAALSDPGSQVEDVRKIYNSYIAARSKTGGEAGLSFEKFTEVVTRQTSSLLAKGAKAVQFRVEIADDKVSLKAKAVRD